ncbi:MAG: hypothetical protein GW763_11215 [Paraglaciecola sp.]|nr:hypothetical protein [Paraglaciecola sp.]NCT48538.1 hypothetical protein [Paraglaciecola sp.]
MASPVAELKKVGQAKLEVLFWDVYESELYSDDGQYQLDTYPLALKIHYLRNIQADDLVERTGEEWQKLGISKQQTAPWLTQLKTLWPDIKKGDELTIVVNNDRSSDFFFNNQSLATIDDRDFGPNFLRIWLDEKCSYPKLRQKLIGK